MPSLLDRLVALGVYDGPTSGIATCSASREYFVFRLLAWDAQQSMRVFSLAPVDSEAAERALEAIAREEVPDWPEWWLRTELTPAAKQSIVSMEVSAQLVVAVVVTRSLLGVWHRCAIVGPGQRDLFERLASTTSEEDEVSIGSFEEWLAFTGASGPDSSALPGA
jgi:hypothetical protein